MRNISKRRAKACGKGLDSEWVAPSVASGSRRRDFVHPAAEMNRARPTTRFGFPRNRFTQRVIDFENTGRVSKRPQPPAISRRQLFTGDSQKFPDRNVQKNSS